MGVLIYDQHGTQQDVDWLRAKFGDVGLAMANVQAGEQVYRLTEIHEREGNASIVATVLGMDGVIVEGEYVVRRWPDAPALPPWDPPISRWFDNGVMGTTNLNGHVGFGLGHGDYYWPDSQRGATAIWCVGRKQPHVAAASDMIDGLGMLAATNHIHLDPTFELVIHEPDTLPPVDPEPPDPGPDPLPPTDLTPVVIQLEIMNVLLARLADCVCGTE